MSDQVIEEVVSASRAPAAAGVSDMAWGYAAIRDPDGRGVWMKASGWDPAEAELKRERVWNHGQRQAGWQYLLRSAGRMLPP